MSVNEWFVRLFLTSEFYCATGRLTDHWIDLLIEIYSKTKPTRARSFSIYCPWFISKRWICVSLPRGVIILLFFFCFSRLTSFFFFFFFAARSALLFLSPCLIKRPFNRAAVLSTNLTLTFPRNVRRRHIETGTKERRCVNSMRTNNTHIYL